MKKQTVYTFLDKKEQEARKLKDQKLQQSLLEAIKQCRTWVERPWADMGEPVSEQIRAMEQEVGTLAEKERQEPLSQEEQDRQAELYMLFAMVYQPFQQKIWSTVRNAQLERNEQARRKAERAQRTSKGSKK